MSISQLVWCSFCPKLHLMQKCFDVSCIPFCFGKQAADLLWFQSFSQSNFKSNCDLLTQSFRVHIESRNVLKSGFKSCSWLGNAHHCSKFASLQIFNRAFLSSTEKFFVLLDSFRVTRYFTCSFSLVRLSTCMDRRSLQATVFHLATRVKSWTDDGQILTVVSTLVYLLCIYSGMLICCLHGLC